MIKNNHFATRPMDAVDILKREFSSRDFPEKRPHADMSDLYKKIARNYAVMENAVAVLSDLRANASHVYYGRFALTLGLNENDRKEALPSIWEDEIFSLIHPDDLADKHFQELCFFNFIKRRPKSLRTDWFLTSRLRMRSRSNGYIPVLHRMFYIPSPSDGSLWLALCLYGPLSFDLPSRGLIVNSVDGRMIEFDRRERSKILSDRERQVLGLIDRGMISKEIAHALSISVNTVSRHRQEILCKLRVKNSIEACRIAREMDLL